MNDYELLTIAQIIREYKYPRYQLQCDLISGKIPHFDADGAQIGKKFRHGGRLYIPRGGVEARIKELSTTPHKKKDTNP